VRNIEPGEELTFAYIADYHYMTTEERRPALLALAFFDQCLCELCTRPVQDRLASEMRRFLVRRLLCVVKGRDLRGVPPTVTSKEIDEGKRLARLYGSARTLGWLFIARLCEAESMAVCEVRFLSYGRAVESVISRVKDLGSLHITGQALSDVRDWAKQSRDLAAVYSLLNTPHWSTELMHIVDGIGEDGGLPDGEGL